LSFAVFITNKTLFDDQYRICEMHKFCISVPAYSAYIATYRMQWREAKPLQGPFYISVNWYTVLKSGSSLNLPTL